MNRDDFKPGDRVVVIDWPKQDEPDYEMIGRIGTVCEPAPAFSLRTLTAAKFVDVKIDDDPRYSKVPGDGVALFFPSEIEVI